MSNDHLNALIHSLNQTEKRYVKLFLQQGGADKKDTKMSRLFDAVNRQKAYDKDRLLAANDFITPTQLGNMRHRLYRQILMGLRAYHSGKSDAMVMHENLTSYEILLHKGLFKQCLKLLVAAEEAAWNAGQVHALTDILEKQKYLVMVRLEPRDIQRYLGAIEERLEDVHLIAQKLSSLEVLHSKLYDVFRKEGRVMRRPEKPFPLEEEFEQLKALGSSGRSVFPIVFQETFIRCLLHQLLGRFDASADELKCFFETYDGQTELFDNYVKEYNRLLNQWVISLNMCGRYEEAKTAIEQILATAKAAERNEEMRLMIFENSVFQELEIYLHQKDFARAVDFVASNLDRIEHDGSRMHSVNQQSKYYRIALAYYGAGKFKESLRWNNRILTYDKLKYRLDIQSSVQLLNLLIHYELGNMDLLAYTLPSTRAHLKKIGRWLYVEKHVIGCLRKIVEGKRPDKAFASLHARLREHMQECRLDQYAMAYFDLLGWVESKAQPE